MPAVNFSCGHCGNLMAVGTEWLGHAVRCPHCQQVVQAPPAAAPPVPPPAAALDDPNFSISPPRDEESIFGRQPEGADDVFGDEDRMTVELPPEPAHAPSPADVPTAALPGEGRTAAALPPTELEFTAAAQEAPTMLAMPSPGSGAGLAAHAGQTTELYSGPADEPASPFEAGALAGPSTPAAPRRAPAEPGLVGIVALIFLVPYALFMTFLAAYLYYQWRHAPGAFELMPDPAGHGDNAGASRGPRVLQDYPLPDRLHVALGRSIQVGDLLVTPEKVEQRRILFCSERAGINPEPSGEDALVLTLRLRNVSDDDYFVPTDAGFDSKWREGEPPELKPYTYLEVGSKKFYGGPIKWKRRGRRSAYRDPDPREYIQGQEDINKVLRPGHERTTVVCTDPENPAVLASAADYRGTLLWRVHLRRGLVDAGSRELSATAVIGVEFQAAQIQKAGG